MTKKQEIEILGKIEELIECMYKPNKRNQIKNEKLKYIIALLLASEHNFYWIDRGLDEPQDDENFVEVANEIAEAFDVINQYGVAINIEVMEDAKNKESS